MFKAQFIGNIGKDAEVRTLESGTSVISFSVAISERWKDKDGNTQERTDWVNCSIWRNQGVSTAISQYLKKGTKVYVDGKPSARGYQASDGSIVASLEVRVDNVELLSSSNNQQQPSAQQPTPPKPVAPARPPQPPAVNLAPTDDDLPF